LKRDVDNHLKTAHPTSFQASETQTLSDRRIEDLEKAVADLSLRLESAEKLIMKMKLQDLTSPSQLSPSADDAQCLHAQCIRKACVPLCCLFDTTRKVSWGSSSPSYIVGDKASKDSEELIPRLKAMSFTNSDAMGWFPSVTIIVRSVVSSLSFMDALENVEVSDSIWDIKKRIAIKLGVNARRIELSLNGVKLRDERMVAMYPIIDGTVLSLSFGLEKSKCGTNSF
jgi:hypothetical protein